MEIARPALLPEPDLDRETMAERQHLVAEAATFEDRHALDVEAIDVADVDRDAVSRASRGPATPPATSDAPIVVGVDQAFRDESVVSAAVALCDGEVLAATHGVRPIAMPYVPGLLVFREGMAIRDALDAMELTPDVVLFDGSGRIHFRQAGLATHLGVLFDVPAIGVAKNLLCGEPRRSLAEPLPSGERVPIEADEAVTAPAGTVIGAAFQSRQFEGPNRHVNPLYVSPGHRFSAETAVDVVEACGGEYKLPQPIRIADARVSELTAGD